MIILLFTIHKFILFILLSFFSILKNFNLVSENYHNYISVFLLAKIGPAFIKISQASQNNFLDLSNIEKNKNFLTILDNIYRKNKFINNNTSNKIKIVEPLSIASGSMAYVYHVKYNNKTSVLKEYCVNNQNIYSSILLYQMLIKMGWLSGNNFLSKIINYQNYYQYFKDQVNSKLEVENMKKFRDLFEKFPQVHIPDCYYYDKKKIIMSYEKGVNLFTFLEENKNNKQIIEETYLLLFACIFKMISEKLIHGDFHAGNLLFFIEDNQVNISIIDFGIILEISDTQKDFFINNLQNIENYHKMDKELQSANFFWHFGNHTKKYSKDEFLKLTVISKKTNKKIILPPEKFVYIPEGGVNIILNKNLPTLGFNIKQEYYNMMITLEILMNKITNLAMISKKFNKKLKQFIIDNDFID